MMLSFCSTALYCILNSMVATVLGSKDYRIRLQAVLLSLLVGTAVPGFKFWAYFATGSNAALPDALESTVNVVWAGFAIGGSLFAGLPADGLH